MAKPPSKLAGKPADSQAAEVLALLASIDRSLRILVRRSGKGR